MTVCVVFATANRANAAPDFAGCQSRQREPLLMQIRLPANYGRRYNEALAPFTPNSPKSLMFRCCPFYGRGLPQATMDAG